MNKIKIAEKKVNQSKISEIRIFRATGGYLLIYNREA